MWLSCGWVVAVISLGGCGHLWAAGVVCGGGCMTWHEVGGVIVCCVVVVVVVS